MTSTQTTGIMLLDELRERGYCPNDQIRAFGTSQDAFDLAFDNGTARVIVEEGSVTEVHLLDHRGGPVWTVKTFGISTRTLEAILESAEAEAEDA